jgi:type II secretory ATPase GspE/PulE/Tfp pilus assembly ATPase PilB-like protein
MAEALTPVPLDDLPPLKFVASGASDDDREATLQAVRPSPGYPHAVLLLADAITKRADLVLMDFTPQQVNVRYQVDGIWHNMPALPRDTADYMLASLKHLAGLDFRERRQRQSGEFVSDYLRHRHKCRITSQGIPAGERVLVEIGRKRPPLDSLEDIGMRKAMQGALLSAINQDGGIVLFSGLPGDGLSTTWRAALQSADRFMRDFYTVQEKSRQEPEIVNVGSVEWNESAGESLTSVLRSLLLREPNAIAFTEIGTGAALNEMTNLASRQGITVVTRLHARHAAEAVMRALLLKPDVGAFAETLRMVVCQRIVRKLCPDCRQRFQPNPEMLVRLGLPPGRVTWLYRQYQPAPEELVDEKGRPVEIVPCRKCGGSGYYERTGLFEMLEVNDAFRQAMRSSPTVQKLSEAAAQSGHVSLRDEGLVLVARGDTSLEELQRVLKK